MTVADYIEAFGEENDHIYEASTLLKWINLVESNVCAENIKEYLAQYYSRTLNEFQFNLPTGVNFTEVTKLHVNGIKYKKHDVREYKKKYTYWLEDDKLCIYPACPETDISYTDDVTFTTSNITGDVLRGFSIGDIVIVSGCTINAGNNKSARIISVSEDTITFSDDTFTAGAETDVTIQKAGIKLVYLNVPTAKVIGDIDTDTLAIPDRFCDIYDYFLMGKIAYQQKEFGEFANHMSMFNARVAEFEKWYEDTRPQNPESDLVAEEDIYTSSFDTD